jgi:pre-mRNA-splicing helicase BRR2
LSQQLASYFVQIAKNSNLVINPNKDLIEKRSRDEPAGEVLPLTADDVAVRMGDKYQRTKPKLLDDQKSPSII